MNFVFIFVVGAIWGSYFYTLSIRLVNGSFNTNGFKALYLSSKCPECVHRIQPLHLIPILGYVILKGKCNECHKEISPVYPFVEIIFGILSIIIVSILGVNIYSVNIFLIIGLSISISIVDIKTLIIPNSMVICFLLLSIYPVILNGNITDNIYGLLLMSIFFITILLIFPGSFGGGDVKFASAIGVLLGLEFSIVALEISLIAGSFIGILYAIKSGRGLRIKIPFAPFLSIGLIISLLYGRDFALLYYRIVY